MFKRPENFFDLVKETGYTYDSSMVPCLKVLGWYGVDSVIFRQSNVYGPSPGMAFNTVVHIFARNAAEGKPLTIQGSGKQSRDFLYIDDAVEAYVEAVKADSLEGIFNLCNSEVYTVEELADTVQEVASEALDREVEVTREELDGTESEIRKFSISNEKLGETLDWCPETDLKEGVRRTVEEIGQPC